MTKPNLPQATYRVHSKKGDSDCGIAAMAIILRRDPEEVLIAAAKIAPTVWTKGLFCTEMVRVARRLKVKARWLTSGQFDPEDATGVLWVSYHDSTKEHCVALIDGKVIDPEHTPPSLWEYDEFCKANNAYGNSLLVVE